MTLTDKAIRDAKPKASAYRLRDSNVVCRGFGVTIAPTGAKAFFLSYTSPEDGKRKQAHLGRYPDVSLREARIEAAALRERINKGHDPAFTKKQDISSRLKQRELGSLKDLMDLYADDLEVDGKRTAKEVRRITGKDIPAHLLSRPARLVSRDDVLDILTPIAQRGAKVPYSIQHIRRLENANQFPRRVRIGPNRVGWVREEVEQWLSNRIGGR